MRRLSFIFFLKICLGNYIDLLTLKWHGKKEKEDDKMERE